MGNRGGQFSGDIAEILTFNRLLDTREQDIVESYLALKYGLTLDQTSPTDYLIAGGTVAWSASAAGLYSGDIAGIGRDDTTSLYQPKSQSALDT